MDVYYFYTYATSAWLATQAVPLLLSPTLITTLLSPTARPPTPLERYLSTSLGLAQLASAALQLILTGSIPLTASLSATATGVDTDLTDPTAPYAVPTLFVSLAYHVATAWYTYGLWSVGPLASTNANAMGGAATDGAAAGTQMPGGVAGEAGGVGGGALAVAMGVAAVLACVGGWVVLFGSTSGRISRKTGADKRTSGFPFKNVQADKKRKVKA